MKAVVAAFNQEKALVGAFSVITKLRVDPRLKLYPANIVRVREARRVQGWGRQALRGTVGADERYINVLFWKHAFKKVGFVTLSLKSFQ